MKSRNPFCDCKKYLYCQFDKLNEKQMIRNDKFEL